MNWFTRYPDLNHTENVWGAMIRDMYRGGRQFYSMSELQSAVLKSLKNISAQVLQTLVY